MGKGSISGKILELTSVEKDFLKNLIFSKTQIDENNCWNLVFLKLSPTGYNQLRFRNKTHLIHRLSFAIFNGPIQAGQVAKHTCGNRQCVNPQHLKLGTQKENMNERKDNISNQITLEDILDIRMLRSLNNYTYQKLSDMYGISIVSIRKICREDNLGTP